MREAKYRAWDKIAKPNRMKTWEQLLAQYQLTLVFTSKDFELMQYTGLHDKNGTEIYEGDICFQETETEVGDERLYCIFTFIEEWNMFVWLNMDEYNEYKEDGIDSLSQTDGYSSDTEHLHYAGNIYDNPELLNK